MLDSHGRIINYLRVSLTDRCNLRCIYCMPEGGIEKKSHEDIMRFEEILEVVKVCASLGIKKVRYTGGEPLILRGIERLIHETSLIPGIEDISITTNGMLLGDMAGDLKKAGLKRVNISLDTLKADKFKRITRGGDINKVFSAIERCIETGLSPVKINTVVIRGINDDEIPELIGLTKRMPVHVRFIELMPIGEGTKLYEYGMISSDEIIEMIPGLIQTDDGSNTARVFRLKDSMGTVGFISPLSCKFCGSCNRIRMTASGTIKPCLHSDNEISIKEYLNNEIMLTSALRDIIYNKPAEHHLDVDKKSMSHRMMYQIGG
jgi:molybdenum cofactor biosynthesis protein A, bacterial